MSKDIVVSSAFKKDLKKLKGKDTGKLKEIIGLLSDGIPIPAIYRDHALTVQWKGYRDAHIEHFQKRLRLVSTGAKPSFGILRGDRFQGCFDCLCQFFRCSGFDSAQDRFHLAPHLLYRIEIRAVCGEIL